MKRTTFKLGGRVLALSAISIVVGCSGRGGTDEADDLGAAAQPAAPESGVTAATAVRPAGITDAMVQEGAQIYSGVGICAACHAADGSGAIGPDLTPVGPY